MIDMTDACLVGFSIFLLYALKTYFETQQVWKQLGAIPGQYTLFSRLSPFGKLTREVKYVTPGTNKTWRTRHEEYKNHRWDAIISISLWPTPKGALFVADAQAAKMITSSRLRFPKPLEVYRIFEFFGVNILTTDFNEWKRHRRIVAPTFSEKNNKLTFEESVRAITSLYEGGWCDKQEVIVDDAHSLMMVAALMTISAAAFGRQINWEDDEPSPGHTISFKRSIQAVGSGLFTKLVCPKWLLEWAPTKKIRETRDGFAEFRSYISEMINEKKLSNDENKERDLLSNLVRANEEFSEDGEQGLSDDELFGNIFMVYFAGHETSGHTLGFTLNMLAVHQEEQEALYQHIRTVLPDGRLPTHEDIPRLNRVTATIYETLRMFPVIALIPKYSVEDTTLGVGNETGGTITFPVPAGTMTNISVPGIHYNPRYWEDPYTFKPERFMGEWNKDAFIPFSRGARACIGRGFFEATGLAILTTLIQRYKVEPHPKFSGESFEKLKERYSENTIVVALT